MKRLLVLLALSLALTGCDSPREIEEKARANGVEKQLPDGCRLIVPGRVNGDLLVVVVCEGRKTLTTLSTGTRGAGKTTSYFRQYVVWIGDYA